MSKEIQFQIPEPCHENWQKMTPVEQGKFCMACQKTVTDFSLMSNEEILLHISKASGNVCGRFMPHQLNRAVSTEVKRNTLSARYAWNMLLAGLLLGSETISQTKPMQGKVKFVSEPIPVPQTQIMGFVAVMKPNEDNDISVVDANDNTPIAFATISIPAKEKAFATDSNGKFSITSEIKMSNSITVSAIGYESKRIPIVELTSNKNFSFIELERTQQTLGEVTVIAYPGTDCSMIAGGLFSVRKTTIFDKIKDTLVTALTKNPIRIFPNPVQKGGIVNIQFGVKMPGNYDVQIVNGAGQVVRQETVSIQMKNQVRQLFIHENYARGVYFIRIKDFTTKEFYQNKFIVK
jgi:hypothetical protein